MGLSATIAAAIATARRVTLDLQPTVVLYQWLGQDTYGKDEYADPKNIRAIVSYETKAIKTGEGKEESSVAYVAILEPVPNVTTNESYVRMNPVDHRDKLMLPNGTTGPILKVNGFSNGETGVPYFSEIWLGRSERSE